MSCGGWAISSRPPIRPALQVVITQMLFQVVVGTLVSLLTFCIHGLATVAIVGVTRRIAESTRNSSLMTRLFALFSFTMTALTVAHLIEIATWTAYYALVEIPVKDVTLFEVCDRAAVTLTI